MTLSKSQIERIQQVHDDELKKDSISELLKTSSHARVYFSALQELRQMTQSAMDQAWDNAETKDAAEKWAEAAFSAVQLVDVKLSDLAPLLERFHDDEVSEFESASVLALMQEREDVANYLERLDVLSDSFNKVELDAHVNFDGFFDKIANEVGLKAKLQMVDLDHSFSYEEHAVLLQRFADGEVNEKETQRVQSWIDSENEEVLATFAALNEIQSFATIAIEHASEEADFTALWSGIEARLEAKEAPVVQLSSFKKQKEEKLEESKKAEKSFFQQYQQGIFTALAAMVLLGVFGPKLFGSNERVIERIVIVDGVTSAPGTSVRIDAPATQNVSAQMGEDEDETTVIWITDESLNKDNVKEEEPKQDGKEKENDEPI